MRCRVHATTSARVIRGTRGGNTPTEAAIRGVPPVPARKDDCGAATHGATQVTAAVHNNTKAMRKRTVLNTTRSLIGAQQGAERSTCEGRVSQRQAQHLHLFRCQLTPALHRPPRRRNRAICDAWATFSPGCRVGVSLVEALSVSPDVCPTHNTVHSRRGRSLPTEKWRTEIVWKWTEDRYRRIRSHLVRGDAWQDRRWPE